MFHVYPWVALVSGTVRQPANRPAFIEQEPRVRGLNLHQHDYAQQFYPSIVVNTRALRSWQLPIWFPATLAGVPNLNGGITEYTHPVRLLLYLTLPPLLQTQAWIFLSVAASFLGTYVLLRSLRLRPAAATLGGVVWSLNGVFVFWGLFENVPAVNALVPWTIYALRIAINNQQYSVAIVAGALWGLMFHTGHLQFVQMWSWAYLFFCTGLLWLRWRNGELVFRNFRPVWILAWIGGIAAAVGAPVLVRTTVWLTSIDRVIPPLDLQLSGALRIDAILRMLPGPGFPGWAYDIQTFPDYALQASLGVAPLILAIVGLVWGAYVRRSLTVVATLSILVGLSVSLGCRPLVILMRSTVPFFGYLHIDNFLYFAHLGIVLLVGLGANGVAQKLETLPPVKSGSRLALFLLCALFVMQGGQGIAAFYLTTPSHPATPQWNFPPTPIIQKARELQGEHRVIEIRAKPQNSIGSSPILTGRLSGLYGLAGVAGYESISPTWVSRLWHSVEIGEPFPETASFSGAFYPNFFDNYINLDLLRRLSIGLIMATPEARLRSPEGADLIDTGQVQQVYHGADGALFVIAGALPRAYLVPKAEIASAADALNRMMDRTFDPTQRVLLTLNKSDRVPALGVNGAGVKPIGTAQIVNDGLTRLAVRVVAHRPAYLQINDTWAPGWIATLDGKPVEVFRSDYAFRALPVPEGEHLVEMFYRPPLEVAALIVEAGALLILVFVSTVATAARFRARRFGQT